MRSRRWGGMALAIGVGVAPTGLTAQPATQIATPARAERPELIALLDELKAYMVPGYTTGVVLDSGASVGEQYEARRMAAKLSGLAAFERRLAAMPVRTWPVADQVDWFVVKSVLNGYRFNLTVLKPWARDPGFYLDPVMRVAFTEVNVTGPAASRLREQLAAVPGALAAARANLTAVPADFADLALFNLSNSDGVNHYHPLRAVQPAGIVGWYDDLIARARRDQPELLPAAQAARDTVAGFRDWLKAARPRMTGQAGVGKARLQWYLSHARFVPYSVDEMLVLAQREHDRLSAQRALTRHANRGLPELAMSTSDAEQKAKVADTDTRLRAWLRDEQVMTVPDDIGPLPANAPFRDRPDGANFWEKVQWRDPLPDHLHATIPGHYFDGVLARRDTRKIRSGYTDGLRVEGWGMYLEEAMPAAGAARGHSPRVMELIQRFGIFRAARVPADIRMQTNAWDVAKAVAYMRAQTPWLDEDVARVDAEIYLRRPPGYGLSYLIGKLQLEGLLAEQSLAQGDAFKLGDFHDRFLAAGRLPIALIRYEMSGKADQLAKFWTTPPIPPAD